MILQDWSIITTQALLKFWEGFLKFIPQLVGALLIFIIGWFISVWIGKFIAEILKRLKLDKLFEKTKWEQAFEKAEFKLKVSDFIGAIVKWVLIIVFLLAAVEVLGLGQFTGFLKAIVGWLPNVVVAAAIFVVAVIIADFAEKLIKAIVGKMEVAYAKLIGSAVKWAIWVFAILAILSQLGVAKDIIQILVTGFVALVVLSSAIAFGLGGKDVAKDILENLRRKIK